MLSFFNAAAVAFCFRHHFLKSGPKHNEQIWQKGSCFKAIFQKTALKREN